MEIIPNPQVKAEIETRAEEQNPRVSATKRAAVCTPRPG